MAGELSGGLLVKIDTSAAIKATNDLKASNAQLFSQLATVDKGVASLEARYKALAAAEAQAASASRGLAATVPTGVPGPGGQFPGFGTPIGGGRGTAPPLIVPPVPAAVPESFDRTTKSGKQLSVVVGQLISATGESGLAKSFKGVAGVGKLLVGALNPVGVAAALVTGALITMGISAITAQSGIAKLRSDAAKAFDDFDLLADGLERSTDSISKLAELRGATFFSRVSKDSDEAIARLEEFEAGLTRARNDLARDASAERLGITNEQLLKLVKGLNLTQDALADLDRAFDLAKSGNAKALDSVLERLAESGIRLQKTREQFAGGLLTKRSFDLTMQQVDAMILFGSQLAETGKQITALRNQRAQSTEGLRVIQQELQDDIRLRRLGNKEREATIALEKELGRPDEQQRQLTDAQIAKRDAILQVARSQAGANDGLAGTMKSLNFQADMLLETSEKQVQAMLREKQIEEELLRLGLTREETAGKALVQTLQRVHAAEDWRKELEKVGDVGAQVGGQLADALSSAAFAAGGFSKNIGEAIADMGRALASQTLREFLSLFGQKAAQLLFTRSNPAPAAGFTPGVFDMQGRVHGAPSEYAQTGLLLDRRQTISRNGRRIGVAEGGQSTPEAIFPLQRDQFGRLSLAAPEGMGEIHVHTNIRTAADARAARPTIRQTVEQIGRAGFRPGARGRA